MLLRRLAPALVLMLAWASVPTAGEKSKDKEKETANPFRTAKVGDFNNYKIATKIGDVAVEGAMKMTISEKDEKFAKLKTEIKVMGATLSSQESTIDLSKPFDVIGSIGQGQKGAKFEKTGEGAEKIKVGAKEYETTWMTGKLIGEAKGLQVDSEVKVWFSKDVPLNGMLRMETKAKIANIVIELTDSGSAK